MAGFQRLWQPEIPIDTPTLPPTCGRTKFMRNPPQPRKKFSMLRRDAFAALALVVVLVPWILGRAAQAQTFTLLHAFTGGAEGGDPAGGLVMDGEGNLYGTTAEGGNLACLHGCGTV